MNDLQDTGIERSIDDGDPVPAAPATPRRPHRLPSLRVALPALAAVAVIGVLLVVFGGRSTSRSAPDVPPGPTTTAGPSRTVPDLGDYPSGQALNVAVAALDPATLRGRPPAGNAAATGQLAVATIQRCAAVLPHASVDRGITTEQAVASAAIAGRPVLIYSYDATATSRLAAGIRIFVVDEASCAIEYAQDH